MKTCMTDDWGPDLRFISCNLVEHLLAYIPHLLDCNKLKNRRTIKRDVSLIVGKIRRWPGHDKN